MHIHTKTKHTPPHCSPLCASLHNHNVHEPVQKLATGKRYGAAAEMVKTSFHPRFGKGWWLTGSCGFQKPMLRAQRPCLSAHLGVMRPGRRARKASPRPAGSQATALSRMGKKRATRLGWRRRSSVRLRRRNANMSALTAPETADPPNHNTPRLVAANKYNNLKRRQARTHRVGAGAKGFKVYDLGFRVLGSGFRVRYCASQARTLISAPPLTGSQWKRKPHLPSA